MLKSTIEKPPSRRHPRYSCPTRLSMPHYASFSSQQTLFCTLNQTDEKPMIERGPEIVTPGGVPVGVRVMLVVRGFHPVLSIP